MTRTAPHRLHDHDWRKVFLAPIAVAALAVTAAALLPSGAEAATSGNLVVDPEFNSGTAAWTITSGATLSVTSGYNGHKAIAITNTRSSDLTVALNDKVNTVASTVKGGKYTASAWIRVSKAGVTAAVREGEWKGSTSMATPVLTSAWLKATAWQFVKVDYTAVSDGASIDLNYLAWQLPSKAVLYVSQPSLVSTIASTTSSAPAPAPVVSSAPASSSSAAPVTSSSVAPVTSSSAAPVTSSSAAPVTSSSVAPVTSSSAAPVTSSSVAPVTSTPPPDPTTSASSPADPSLVFDDEFNGTSVDTSKWHVRNNSWASNELSIDTSRPDNVFVSNGVLTLRAQRETYTVGSTTRNYTSGYLDTIGLSAQQYGRWEMRAKLPQAKGLWPAFWLRGNSSSSELDILEAIGGMPTMTVQTAFPDTNNGSVKKSNAYYLPSTNDTSQWHVYGVSWTPTSMSWYVDGTTVFTINSTDVPWVASAFQDPMNIRLNLQVGGSMPNYFNQPVDSSSALPDDFQVDWVRVWNH